MNLEKFLLLFITFSYSNFIEGIECSLGDPRDTRQPKKWVQKKVQVINLMENLEEKTLETNCGTN